jgi:hypothetical protein
MNGVRLSWCAPLTVALAMIAVLMFAVSAWAAPSPTAVDGSSTLLGVACPAAGQCTAVDSGGREVTFNPTAPSGPAPTTIDANNSLTAVACPSVSQCTAVDNYGR